MGENVSWITSVQIEILTIMDTKIYSKAVQICEFRDDTFKSVIMWCFLSVNYLVDAEGTYHKN